MEDDGRGIDYERVRQGVVDSGAMSPVAAAELSERELREFLFRPGFSTASSTSELAGRGVGLDVVRANVHALNGEVEVRSELGQGACFTVKVPLTLIISQALFVRCGTSVFALPLAVIEEIRRLRPDEIEDVGGKLLTRVRDVVTEVVRLDLQLGLPPLEPLNGYFHMVIVKVAGKHVGVVVEEVLGKDEIVIKNLGDYLRRVKLFPGTTIASDGSLILLIDLNRLVSADASDRHALPASSPAARVFAPGAEAVAAGSIPAEAVDPVENDQVVVVADDSISVRKFVGRMLEKAGYRVKLASDGLEASEIIAQVGCHLVITDLEMPRMNGYELLAHLRQDPVTRRIPVLVVTSRAGAKHRDRALKEGASGFLTKPVQEDQLMSIVDSLLGSNASDEPGASSGASAGAAGLIMTKGTEKKIRVLVVDDSAFMCKVLEEIINADPQLEVAGQARNGRDAVVLAESLRPDVITMDINMPHVDGLQATELIMSQHPRPIVIVSSESREGAASTLRALELGAIDFVPKPSSGIDLDMRNVREDLTRKLKLAAKVRVIRTATRSKASSA